jgi:predicted amidophosphoribosyltransferase
MSVFRFQLPPIQDDFDEEDVRGLDVGRRQLCTEWPNVLYKPQSEDRDWALILPFPNTYRNAFETMCNTQAWPHVAGTGKLCLYLKGIDRDIGPPQEVHDWIATVGKYVAMKDMLALSFALDYERQGGNPNRSQTSVGALRAQAKPYGSQVATPQTKAAADQLIDRCLEFLNEMTCYKSANCVVAMPPSDPTKQYNLPRYMAAQIAARLGLEDLSKNVRTIKARSSIKAVPLTQKLDTLLGTIEVGAGVFDGKHVLLIDDLYQSGISLNYCAFLLLQAGAKKIFGLACEKTCRNDDNVSGRI